MIPGHAPIIDAWNNKSASGELMDPKNVAKIFLSYLTPEELSVVSQTQEMDQNESGVINKPMATINQ